jgi:hypothetical protein
MASRKRSSGSATIARRVARIADSIVREQRAMRKAVRGMPRPVPWDWAKERILPLLAGPYLDGDPSCVPVRLVMEPGCAVIFGIHVGGMFPMVDNVVAERWECSPEQIRDVAMENLGVRAAGLAASTVTSGTLSGRIVRLIDRNVDWAASLILLPDELMRLFGSHDQLLAAPGWNTLMSFSLETPMEIVADIVDDFEQGQSYPLFLDPFLLEGGRLSWSVAGRDPDDAGD